MKFQAFLPQAFLLPLDKSLIAQGRLRVLLTHHVAQDLPEALVQRGILQQGVEANLVPSAPDGVEVLLEIFDPSQKLFVLFFPLSSCLFFSVV